MWILFQTLNMEENKVLELKIILCPFPIKKKQSILLYAVFIQRYFFSKFLGRGVLFAFMWVLALWVFILLLLIILKNDGNKHFQIIRGDHNPGFSVFLPHCFSQRLHRIGKSSASEIYICHQDA